MKKPLKAPARAPISEATGRPQHDAVPRVLHWLASVTLTSEITAAAERSKPPDRMTIVWPMAAIASVVPPAASVLSS